MTETPGGRCVSAFELRHSFGVGLSAIPLGQEPAPEAAQAAEATQISAGRHRRRPLFLFLFLPISVPGSRRAECLRRSDFIAGLGAVRIHRCVDFAEVAAPK